MALRLNREIRAVLLLVPALAVTSWLAWSVYSNYEKPAENADFSNSESVRSDQSPASQSAENSSPASLGPNEASNSTENSTEKNASDPEKSAPRLFEFDPNTVSFHDLMRLGFSRSQALGIVKYRERGKVFEIAEDFAACSQVSETMYVRLLAYIKIGEKFQLRRWASRDSGRGTQDASNSSRGGSNTTSGDSHLSRDTAMKSRPQQRREPILVDLNAADSSALVAVRGIGPRTAGAIVAYRDRLGGFMDVGQLAEVAGVTEQNFALAEQFFFVDPAVITKFNIIFAPAKQLAAHPYITGLQLRKLLKARQLKGG